MIDFNEANSEIAKPRFLRSRIADSALPWQRQHCLIVQNYVELNESWQEKTEPRCTNKRMGIESQTLISLRRCTGCFARKPTIGGLHPQNVSQNLWVLEPSWNSTPQNRTVLLHVPPGIKDLKVYSATQNLRKVVLLWMCGSWAHGFHVKRLNFRNPSRRTSSMYIYIYICI